MKHVIVAKRPWAVYFVATALVGATLGCASCASDPEKPNIDAPSGLGEAPEGSPGAQDTNVVNGGNSGSTGESETVSGSVEFPDVPPEPREPEPRPDVGDEPQPETGLPPPSTSPVLRYCPFSDPTDLSTFEGRAVVRLCPRGDKRAGCDTDSLPQAISMAQSGDRIEIVKGTAPYTQCATIPARLSDVEIVGVCGRPHLKDAVCAQKGLFVNLGQRITFTNLEISHLAIPASAGGNAAAIRDQSLGDVTLRYVYFHHNQNGLLGGKGTMTIDWSRFEANGSSVDPGYTHNIYVSADVDALIIRNSLFLRANNEGNNFKSRAKTLRFECSVSASLDGLDSAELDISEGGRANIVNSLIEQGPPSVNSGMLNFAMEAGNENRRHATQALTITGTDFINDRQAGGAFIKYRGYNGLTIDASDNRFIGKATKFHHQGGDAASLNETGSVEHPNRDAAGLPAYSTDLSKLPKPRNCPNFEYF